MEFQLKSYDHLKIETASKHAKTFKQISNERLLKI